MEIEITIEEIIKLMKELVGKEEQTPPIKRNEWTRAIALEAFEATSDSQVTAPVVIESSKTTKRSPWSQAEKAWLFAQGKPSKGNNHHINELQQRFGVKRTEKSISGVWRRFHDNN